ncbi:hypothetical protein [Bradyrhizobium elkanii]|uniref:hypothetical protein n=1 Tax=Bradyrhizobium elkanii TaxID=29448 RepID=UPI003513F85C
MNQRQRQRQRKHQHQARLQQTALARQGRPETAYDFVSMALNDDRIRAFTASVLAKGGEAVITIGPGYTYVTEGTHTDQEEAA